MLTRPYSFVGNLAPSGLPGLPVAALAIAAGLVVLALLAVWRTSRRPSETGQIPQRKVEMLRKYDSLAHRLERLVAAMPYSTGRKTREWYTRTRLLEEVLYAVGAGEQEVRIAHKAYAVLALLAASVQGPAVAHQPRRGVLTRQDAVAFKLRHAQVARAFGEGAAASREMAGAVGAVLRLLDEKAAPDLLGQPAWVQGLAVVAADAGLLPSAMRDGLLVRQAAAGGRLLTEYASAKEHLMPPPRRGDLSAAPPHAPNPPRARRTPAFA